tara:strand:- start:36 stop:383 length:348 start_codon:yes stop_codon:yes gene_type:complete
MSFMQSAQVRAALVEIHELQEVIVADAVKFPDLDVDDQYVHIDNLETLLEKQRIMYTRLSLSDDPEAMEMKKDIEDSMGLLGLQQNVDPGELFRMMQDTIVNLREFVEKNELDNL